MIHISWDIWDIWDILGEFGFVRRISADTAGAHEMPEGSLPWVWQCLQNKLGEVAHLR